ncbi:hypothetical protein OC844_003215 [Tilletia horrida]|nr:hypothetical protein OC844_003215 [Tilletia horrida]
MSLPTDDAIKLLSEPLTFPSGKTAPNRLTKAAMAEMLAQLGGSPPTPALLNLYRQWAEGGWGMIITGNVAVERSHLGMPFDVSLPHAPAPPVLSAAPGRARGKREGASTTAMWPSSNEYARLVQRFGTYAAACRSQKDASASPLSIVQLVHAGRQSIRGFGRAPWSAPLAPSAVPMRTTAALGPWLGGLVDWALWSHPREMSTAQIAEVVNQFAASAKLAADAGFDGVELHASHGYLLSAFLSPRTNRRTDGYGGSAEKRMRILLEIVDAVRQRVPSDFVVGVKLNSSDYIAGGLTEEDALENVRILASHGGVDFVEISGGNYENPSFMGDKFDADAERDKIFGPSAPSSVSEPTPTPPPSEASSKRRKQREAFFLSFAARARSVSSSSSPAGQTPLRIIVTGGLRSRAGMAECISAGGADGVGLGRASVVDPHLPLRVLSGESGEDEAKVREYTIPAAGLLSKVPIQVVGAGWTTLWHTVMLHWLAHASPPSGRQPATRTQPLNAGPLRAALIVAFGRWAVPREKEE